MHRIYWLDPSVREEDRLRYGSGMKFETELCRGNPNHTERQTRPHQLRLIVPSPPLTDFQWTPYEEAIVSSNVVTVFQASGLIGYEFRKIQALNTMGEPTNRELYEMRITGWGGTARRQSGVRVLEECGFCKRRVFSGCTNPNQLFNFEDWDGSDLFMIWPLPRYIMASGAAREVIVHHRFTGVTVKPLEKLPVPIAGTLTPGNLRDWLDGDRVGEAEREVEKFIREIGANRS
jgi:hypothetical protein